MRVGSPVYLLSYPAATTKTPYVSLHSPRRKFAQVTRATNTAVDLTLRLDIPAGDRVNAIRVRADDPFDRRVRLAAADQVDEDTLDILAAALDQDR